MSVFKNLKGVATGVALSCATVLGTTAAWAEETIKVGVLHSDPTRFDVLLLENLYGDVVSDLCAGFVGGLGVVPGANFGHDRAVFEAVHGSAPDIAGKNLANPLAMLMTAVMMLKHLADSRSDASCRVAAEHVEHAYNQALEDGLKTPDLGGELSTDAFTDALIERLPLGPVGP